MATTPNVQSALVSRHTTELRFPFLDLKAQYAGIRAEVLAAVVGVLESQHFILGSEVERLESAIARYVGADFAIGCASGSDALVLSLMALGIDAGDDVITSPFTFIATAGAIARVKARPVFVDIDAATFNLDTRQLEAAITSKTRAVLPVHLFGLPADMSAVMEVAHDHKLSVVEDAAQAIGARHNGRAVGSIGTMACLSFFPSKNLGGAGDGGMITTNSPELAERLRLLRVHGSRRRYQYELLGINSRLDALQAAILRVKLGHVDQWTAARQRNARRYREAFSTIAGLRNSIQVPVEPEACVHVYNQFVIRAQQRDALKERLREAGLPAEVYYPSPLHLQPAFAYLGYRKGDFPRAEAACEQVLALPIFPELSDEQQQTIIDEITAFYCESSA